MGSGAVTDDTGRKTGPMGREETCEWPTIVESHGSKSRCTRSGDPCVFDCLVHDSECSVDVSRSGNCFPNNSIIGANSIIFEEGDEVRHATIMMEGFAMLYRMFEGGGRSVLRIVFPGEFVMFPGWAPVVAEFTAKTMTSARIRSIPLARLEAIARKRPEVGICVAARLAEELRAVQRQLAALGRLSAEGRLAALLLHVHQRTIGTSSSPVGAIPLPISLALLADAVGLTPVHVCRILKKMRLDGLLRWEKKHLSILDPARLSAIGKVPESAAGIGRRSSR